jgi:hypothetical protein
METNMLNSCNTSHLLRGKTCTDEDRKCSIMDEITLF